MSLIVYYVKYFKLPTNTLSQCIPNLCLHILRNVMTVREDNLLILKRNIHICMGGGGGFLNFCEKGYMHFKYSIKPIVGVYALINTRCVAFVPHGTQCRIYTLYI